MMRFGCRLTLDGFSLPEIVGFARTVEDLGYDSVWVNDHLIGGPPAEREDEANLEGWTTLSALASYVRRVRLGVLVLCNSFREPSITAKMSASLDAISEGRLEFGLGAGWYEEEHIQYGFPFPSAGIRLSHLDEALEIIRRMWTEDESDYRGEHYVIEKAICEPKPLQDPHPPVWVGGKGRSALRVVAKHGDAFCPWSTDPDEYRALRRTLKEHCDSLGRDPGDLVNGYLSSLLIGDTDESVREGIERRASRRRVSVSEYMSRAKRGVVGTPEECEKQVRAYEDAGVEYLILRFRDMTDTGQLELFAENVMNIFQ